jgi:hypothetical protein
MISLAISSDVFSETDPVKQLIKILEMPSRVVKSEKIDSNCLGS